MCVWLFLCMPWCTLVDREGEGGRGKPAIPRSGPVWPLLLYWEPLSRWLAGLKAPSLEVCAVSVLWGLEVVGEWEWGREDPGRWRRWRLWTFLGRWAVETVELGSWSGLIFYLKYQLCLCCRGGLVLIFKYSVFMLIIYGGQGEKNQKLGEKKNQWFMYTRLNSMIFAFLFLCYFSSFSWNYLQKTWHGTVLGLLG